MHLRVAAVWVLALAAGAFSLVAPRSAVPPLEVQADGTVEVRASAPDLVHGALVDTSRARVRPPWTRGAPADGSLVVTPAPLLPRPFGLFSPTTGAPQGWRAWTGPESEAPAPASRDLAELLSGARVSIVSDDGTERVCDRWVFGRWVCGPNSWNWVGPAEVRVRGRRRACVWMHPSEEGTVRVELGSFAGGSQLRGYVMLDDGAVAEEESGVVTLTILADGRRIASRDQGNRPGTTSVRERLPSADEPVALALEVDADATGRRHFCVELSVLEPSEEP